MFLNVSGHGEGVDLFALDSHQFGQAFVGSDDSPIFFCLQLMLLDVAPKLLDIFTSWSRFESGQLDKDFIALDIYHDVLSTPGLGSLGFSRFILIFHF